MVERVAALSAVDAASRRMVTLQLGQRMLRHRGRRRSVGRHIDGPHAVGEEMDDRPQRRDTTTGGREGRVDAGDSTVAVWVVHVDEAGVAARDAVRVLNGTDTG
jgi:hypothetical protein